MERDFKQISGYGYHVFDSSDYLRASGSIAVDTGDSIVLFPSRYFNFEGAKEIYGAMINQPIMTEEQKKSSCQVICDYLNKDIVKDSTDIYANIPVELLDIMRDFEFERISSKRELREYYEADRCLYTRSIILLTVDYYKSLSAEAKEELY